MKKHTIVVVLFSILYIAVPQAAIMDESDYPEDDISVQIEPIVKVDQEQQDSLANALMQGSFKGLLRYNGEYRDSNLHVPQDSSTPNISRTKKQQYSTIGGYIGYETAPWHHTSIGATVYTSNPIGNNPDDRSGLGGLYEADGGQDDYTVIGEAYIQYQKNQHRIKIGRQEMNYRDVSTSDVRMTPRTHQAIIYENTVVDNLQLNLAYIDKMKDRNAKHFKDMATSSRIKTGCGSLDCVGDKLLLRGDYDPNDYGPTGQYVGDNKQMLMLGAIYSKGNLNVEVWDYYAQDLLNSLYLYSQYNLNEPDAETAYSVAAQYGNQQDVGDHIAGNIDTWYYGVKLVAKKSSGLGFFTSYNQVDYNEDSYDGGSIFIPWGGAQMFNSFQVQDSELAGTKSYGVGVEYDFDHDGFWSGGYVRMRYGVYDMPDNLDDKDARQDRSEMTFDVVYKFDGSLDGLKMRLRYARNDYDTDYDFDTYQTNHGYEINSVTDDFNDVRLYVDYAF